MPTARPGSPVDSPNAISTSPVIEIRSLAPDESLIQTRCFTEECGGVLGLGHMLPAFRLPQALQ
jgi:hypothetical protein